MKIALKQVKVNLGVKKMKQRVIFLMAVSCIAVCLAAQRQVQVDEGVNLTVYNANFAVVRDARKMKFEEGVNTVKFTDVASAIDPTSVNFKCLSSPEAVSILEQNYEYDLVNQGALLRRYIDKNVTVMVKGSGADAGRAVTGQLLSAAGGELIIKGTGDVIEVISGGSVEEISLKEMPDDLVTKPTLVWLAQAKEKSEQLCQVAYTTEQIRWNADYSAVLNAQESAIDFSGWVTIDNKSGATYKDAGLKLIAGDVRRIVEERPMMMHKAMVAEAQGGFEEKPFMEYHLYTLGRKSTINNNQVKQIEFIASVANVPVKKLYIYDRNEIADKIQIKLEFENTKANKLGIALPEGKVRVFKKDPADDTLEFVGEDKIDHTPKGEKLSLYIGNAFDIVPEYTLVNGQVGRRMQKQTHKVELRNRKAETVVILVDEKFPQWVNWSIDDSTHKYEKRDARTARFTVEVKADTAVALQYTVTQTW